MSMRRGNAERPPTQRSEDLTSSPCTGQNRMRQDSLNFFHGFGGFVVELLPARLPGVVDGVPGPACVDGGVNGGVVAGAVGGLFADGTLVGGTGGVVDPGLLNWVKAGFSVEFAPPSVLINLSCLSLAAIEDFSVLYADPGLLAKFPIPRIPPPMTLSAIMPPTAAVVLLSSWASPMLLDSGPRALIQLRAWSGKKLMLWKHLLAQM